MKLLQGTSIVMHSR